MNRSLIPLLLVGLIFVTTIDASAQTCDSLSFDVSAELTSDPGYEGMYKYTISGYWGVSGVEQGWGLSYLMFSLGTECPCLCDSTFGLVEFPDPAGISTGMDSYTEEPCEVVYLGFVECDGLEDITSDVAIKFEVPDYQTCEPIHYGTGTWIFYSTLPPLPWSERANATMIKYGEMACWGDISGQFPNCYECVPVSTEARSWGSIKSIYR
ncbi:MAG: hypothetical protein KAV42_05325 [Candidatus Krumholzibacteria bacterium]|nr:hypothetical protein [Candidatus Krumholzibacteria bacterium]